MWKHEILTDYDSLVPYTRLGIISYEILSETKKYINNSICIHAGDFCNYKNAILKSNEEMSYDKISLPYDTILITYSHSNNKRCVLIKKQGYEDFQEIGNHIMFMAFEKSEKGWSPLRDAVCFLEDGGYGFANIWDTGEIKNDPNVYGPMGAASTAYFILKILTCKNVSLVPVDPPEALNRSRIKKGKLPHYRYHVLTLDLDKGRQLAGKSNGHSFGAMPVHLCRGHFKEYTEEKPLFGRVTGRFWWQPFARGKAENGIVMKDYKIKKQVAQ